MTSHEIRSQFLDFFKSKGHQIVPSAPLVIKNDPTLMFTNAGMNQFKDYFLGNKIPQFKRIADTQKCLRVSGKHNDLEEVGHDTYHHTMFEMLGNWSFGDYFKKEALEWAWELLTEVYKLPKERLYVSVFEGDTDDNLPADDEARDIWKTMIDESRILYGSKKDNFWEMGDTGPCGPCSEIHIDLRPQEEVNRVPGKDLVNNDHPQVVEIWNNVFIQFERQWNPAKGGANALLEFETKYSGDKTDSAFKKARAGKHSEVTMLKELPAKHVDTGMGFERLCMAIQKKQSNYDTDVFQPLIQFIATTSGKKYGQEKWADIAMRVIADHIRAISFTIADGQLPSNNKAGYVIRRILRRAVRYGYTYLGFKEPFLYRIVPVLANQFANVFPELKAQEDFVAKVIREEESTFLRTLGTGIQKFEDYIENEFTNLDDSVASVIESEFGEATLKTINGEFAFQLYDTFGFPKDLTDLLAREKGWLVDDEGFVKAMQVQKERSRAAASSETGDWITVSDEEDVQFLGYDELETYSHIIKYREIKNKNKTQYQIVLDKTPFYAESGGQVGDTGYLEANSEKVYITDTKKENDLIIHFTDKLPSNLEADFHAVVNASKRSLTQNNHSATHLLHAALKQVLGNHVNQKGSLVNDNVLRFDFSHFTKMTDEEIARVEKIVNQKIRENIVLDEKRNVPIAKATAELGATALFGEKYGDFVRVITFDPKYSVELCGGTHVKATGQIGYFKIVSESAVAAGVRRIEAITAEKAETVINEQLAVLSELKELLKNPKDLVKSVESLLEEKNQLSKQIEAFQLQEAQAIKADLLNKVIKNNGVTVIAEKVSLPTTESLKKIAYELNAKVDNLFLVLAANVEGKPQIAVMISDNLVQEKKLNAGAIVKELAKEIKGGGGGQPFFATAGGTDINGLDRVVEKARALLG
ncbi:alanine--tRNA ligase [Rhodocytophaga rosea]|uniref:Alanine--tRNA ligase n=1 Tax=Rhodocytophaga rosea TaxID=2704465 RepID=A0A6C0GHZ8_9BACT|nr:alanine--tRNA ligase [Rhodocytophaga rosea]QHT67525.1 alanine--tRNA ligase [Rhodocytophaga rosea]